MLIKSTNLRSARLMDFFQVMSDIRSFLGEEEVEQLGLLAYVHDFEASLFSLDKALLQAQKTGYTKKIAETDSLRNSVFTGFIGSVRSMKYFPDKGIADAAGRILNAIKKYGSGIQRLPQREETATLFNLLQDLREESLHADLKKTGLNIWVGRLESANRNFDELYMARTRKESEFIVGLTRSERDKMQNAFDRLCKAIDSLAFLQDEADYKRLADKINMEVEKVQKAIKARYAGKSGNAEEVSELPLSPSYEEGGNKFKGV
ncbi:MAG: hypothetical protein CSB06_03310 [Bacteroidia bacterium]|nr:MAG: hypothetical protein CSB06_03310 [Bacteroidia bacterium]